MNRSVRILLAALLVGGLGACQSNTAVYSRPLQTAGQPAPAEKEKSAASTEPYPYTLANLAPGYHPEMTSDEGNWWWAVERVEQATKTAGNLVHDPDINAYVKGVACRVAGNYCGDIRVYVIRAPGFNASMYPNGMMLVRTGLLVRVRNEAQLAAVLGHEIGHYLRRHTVERMRDAIDKTNAVMFVNIALATVGIPVVGNVLSLATMASISAYSRDQEREADGYGLLLMGKAGYDPHEDWKIWETLTKEMDADDGPAEPTLFADHPPTGERLEVAKQLADRVPVEGKPIVGREALQSAILPHRADYLRDELFRRHFKALEVLLDSLIEGGSNVAELYFFKGEVFRQRLSDGDLEKAVEAYQKAIDSGAPPPEVYRSLGLVRRKLGKKEEAADAFRQYLNHDPQAEDAEMIRQIIRECQSS